MRCYSSLPVLFALLVIGCLALKDLNIGTIVSKAATTGNNAYCMEGFYFELAAQVAAKYVNDNPEILPNHHLKLNVADIKQNRYETLTVTRNLITSHLNSTTGTPIVAIVGAGDDDLNELIQLVVKEFSIPQLSYESHSTELSDLEEYPMFARMSASQDFLALSLLKLIEKYRWQRFNVIAPDDSDGSNAVDELRKAIPLMSAEFQEYITLGEIVRYPALISLPLTESQIESVNSALSQVRSSGNRINILFAGPTQAAAFLYMASQAGMTGNSWVYIGTDWNSLQLFLGLEDQFRDVVKNAMDGMVGISPYIGNVAELDTLFNEYLTQHPTMQTEAKELCGKEIVVDHDMYPEYTIFVYDAVITIATALNAVLTERPNITFTTPEEMDFLWQKILNVSFEGMSGKVDFQPGVGDRLPVKMEVVNIYNGEIIDIGDIEFYNSTSYRFVIDNVPHWPGGSTAVPTDRSDSSEEYLAVYIALTLLWLSVACIAIALLERWEIHRFPVGGVIVFFGIIGGLAIRFLQSEVTTNAVIEPKSITLLLLPVIIFESGLNMKTKGIFFKNIGTILIYAIFGTICAALITGSVLSILFHYKLFEPIEFSTVECLIFGSLITAADAVSALGIFSGLNVEPMLTMLVYGEFIINDTVSIEMFNTMSTFLLRPMSFMAICSAFWTFIVMFFGSAIIGAVLALVCCLILKYVRFPSAVTETSIVFLFGYLAFEIAETRELAGITASLSCGMMMNYFGLRNMSKEGQSFCQKAVKVASFIADSMICFQVGVNVFLESDLSDVPWALVLAVYVTIMFSRALVVAVITNLVNLKRTRSKIDIKSQIIMIYSGMRGTTAYSMALVFPSHNQEVVTRVTMWVVMITMFFQGCTLYDILHLMKIPLNVTYDHTSQNVEGRKRRSVMALGDSFASKLYWWIENKAIPFFTVDQKENEQLLLNAEEMDKEYMMMESGSPMDNYTPLRSPVRYSGSSLTKVVKGHDGKAVVNNVVNVEADVLDDDNDLFVIPEDEVNNDVHLSPRANVDIARLSVSSNLSMRNSQHSVGSK